MKTKKKVHPINQGSKNLKQSEKLEYNPYGKTFYSEIRSWIIKGKKSR